MLGQHHLVSKSITENKKKFATITNQASHLESSKNLHQDSLQLNTAINVDGNSNRAKKSLSFGFRRSQKAATI